MKHHVREHSGAEASDLNIDTIGGLTATARATGRAAFYRHAIKGLGDRSTTSLVERGGRTADPLMLWVLHSEMQRRGVPPCLRWDVAEDTRQQMFMTFMADVVWLAKAHPAHQTDHERWRNLFAFAPSQERWQKLARWFFVCGRCAQAGTHFYSKGLGLSDAQRQPLMMLLSNKMRGERRLLNALPVYGEALHVHALAHRDKSGTTTPLNVATRRTEMLRVFLLAGKNSALAADFYRRLSGTRISRQAFTRHVEHIELATGLQLCDSRG